MTSDRTQQFLLQSKLRRWHFQASGSCPWFSREWFRSDLRVDTATGRDPVRAFLHSFNKCSVRFDQGSCSAGCFKCLLLLLLHCASGSCSHQHRGPVYCTCCLAAEPTPVHTVTPSWRTSRPFSTSMRQTIATSPQRYRAKSVP